MRVNQLNDTVLRSLSEVEADEPVVVRVFLNLDPSEFATASARESQVNSLLGLLGDRVREGDLSQDAKEALESGTPIIATDIAEVIGTAIGLTLLFGIPLEIGVVITALVVGALLIWVPADLGGPVPFLRWAVPVVVVLDALVELVVRPRLKHRVYRWEVTEDAVYTRTGWLSQTWTLVPVSRIQTVDVTRGLLQQMFGLATVAVFTASSQGTVRIWHLEHGMAQRVADDLAARAERTRDQAT